MFEVEEPRRAGGSAGELTEWTPRINELGFRSNVRSEISSRRLPVGSPMGGPQGLCDRNEVATAGGPAGSYRPPSHLLTCASHSGRTSLSFLMTLVRDSSASVERLSSSLLRSKGALVDQTFLQSW